MALESAAAGKARTKNMVLRLDPALAERLRTNASIALRRLDADAEWRKLVTLYDSLPRVG